MNRARPKVLGRVQIVAPDDAPQVMAAVTNPQMTARAERVFLIDVEAYDWNCPQHITPRYTVGDIAPSIERYESRIRGLENAIVGAGASLPALSQKTRGLATPRRFVVSSMTHQCVAVSAVTAFTSTSPARAISIRRGFSASGVSRTRSMCSMPRSCAAPATRT